MGSEIAGDKEVALKNLKKALETLKEGLQRDYASDRLLIDGIIQRYEYCIELSWKTFQKFVRDHGAQVVSPKEALTKAYSYGWIDEEALWINMLQDRNLTSHLYHQDLADEVMVRIPDYYEAMQKAYLKLVSLD